MAYSQQSVAETLSSTSLVDEWLTLDSRGHQRACRLNDVLFVGDIFSEAFDFMQKAVNTIQQTTQSWSVKTGESWSTRHVVLRCAISKYSTRVRRGEDGKFVRHTNGGGGGKGTPKTYTGSRRHFDCHAHIELAIVDHDKAEAAKGKKPYSWCRNCGERYTKDLAGHEAQCTSQMPKDIFICQRAACRKRMKNNKRSRQAHARFCAAFHVVVSKIQCRHNGHEQIFTRQASMAIGPLHKAYLRAIGGQPSAETRRVALDAVMALDPSLLATMQMGYNIEASLRRANGISSDGNTPTDVTAKFVAALSLCSDVSFVIQGTNKSGAPFSIVQTAGTGLVAFYASHNFRREHQWLFGERPYSQSAVSTESAAPAASDSASTSSSVAFVPTVDEGTPTSRADALSAPDASTLSVVEVALKKIENHPNDCRVCLDDVEHTYSVDECSEFWTSVTTLVNPTFNRDVAARREAGARGVKVRVILDEWDQSREAGILLHQRIEKRLNDGSIGLISDEDGRKEWAQVESFLAANARLRTGRTEWSIFDKSLYLAGTCDAVFVSSAGEYVLVDWKRTSKVTAAKKKKWAGQLCMYKYILQT